MMSRNTLVQIFICLLLESLVHPWMMGQSFHTWRGYQTILMLIFPGAKIQWYLYGLLWWRFMNLALQRLPELYRFVLAFLLAACPGFQLLGAATALRSPGFTCRRLSPRCLPFYVVGQMCRASLDRMEETYRDRVEGSILEKNPRISARCRLGLCHLRFNPNTLRSMLFDVLPLHVVQPVVATLPKLLNPGRRVFSLMTPGERPQVFIMEAGNSRTLCAHL